MPFEPEDITGAVAVWVADDVAQGDGTAVAAWADRIASYSLAQATSGQQPLYRVSGIGGQPAVDFDGSNDSLVYAAASALSTASSGSIFMVLQRGDAIDGNIIWSSCDEGSIGTYMVGEFVSSGKLGLEQRNNTDTDDILNGTTTSVGSGAVCLAEWRSADTSYELRVNNTIQSKNVAHGADTGDWFADTSFGTRDSFTLGCMRRTSEQYNWHGKIAAVIVVDGAISSDDRTSLDVWVQIKYGIDLGLIVANTLHESLHLVAATLGAPTANTLHESLHLVTIPIRVNTLHESLHLATARAAPTAQSLHVTAHLTGASRVVATSLHSALHLIRPRSPIQVRSLHLRMFPGSGGLSGTGGSIGGSVGTAAYPGGFPTPAVLPRSLELHLLGKDGHDFGTLTGDRERTFQHVLCSGPGADTGSGRVKIKANNPLWAELSRGRILSAHMYDLPDPVFDFLLEPGQISLLASGEEDAQGKTLGGRGTLAYLADAIVHPQRSNDPQQNVIVFNYCHEVYDASAWVPAKQIVQQGINPSPLWWGLPAQWDIPEAWWIWSNDGSAFDAPSGTRWFRREFNLPQGPYVHYSAADNAYEMSMDGPKVVSAGDLQKTTGAFWDNLRTPVDLVTGTHILGAKVQNYEPTVEGANPAGFLYGMAIADPDGIETAVAFTSDNQWMVFPDLTPGAFPGVTVGAVMLWLINRAQFDGALEFLTVDFDELVDSAGNPWPLIESMSATIGKTLLETFLAFCKLGYCDLNVVPGTLKLQAFQPGTLSPPATASLAPPHVEEATYTEQPILVNAYLVRYDSGFFFLEDDASIAAHGRIEGFLSCGDIPFDAAYEQASVQLELTKNPNQSQIAIKLPTDVEVRPYVTFGVGSDVPVIQEDRSVAPERVTGITVTEQGDLLQVVPTLRSRILEQEDRLEQWLQSFSAGVQGGIFQGGPAPPPAQVPAATADYKNEVIHQRGPTTVATSPAQPIFRSGKARMFVLFLGGQLSTAPITASCLINGIVVATTTIATGQRYSPLARIVPVQRVFELRDFWSMQVTAEGADGTDLQAHLLVR